MGINKKRTKENFDPSTVDRPLMRYLKTKCHGLDPVVNIGKAGVTEGITKAADEALDTHELIKVKLLQNCPLGRDEATAALLGPLNAALIQEIGRVFVLYRPAPEVKVRAENRKKKE